MRQIVKLLFGLSFVLLASCSTQQRVVYRDCNCNTSTFGFGWNTNPYWGLNDTYWGWNRWNRGFNGVIPRIQPSQPSRYERRQSIGSRPSRLQQNEPTIYERRTSSPQIQRNSQPTRTDNMYPQRTQPSRVQNNTPSRVETPSRVQQRQNTPVTTQPTRSRVQNEPISDLKPKWYAPQQSTNGNTTPMVNSQFRYQSSEGFGINGSGSFQRNY